MSCDTKPIGLFDLHCDTITECSLQNQPLRENSLHLSLGRGRAYLPWIQCFAVWLPDEIRGAEAVGYFDRVLHRFQHECQCNDDWMLPCRCAQDLQTARQQGKCGAVLTVEGGAVLAGEISRVKLLAQQGVRMLTLTWNGSCEMGDGAMVEHPKGLTAFGKLAVPELERCNILIDVSHASDPLFDDVAARAARPFVASHSNSRAVCQHPRNLTDQQFVTIRDRGGLVGLNFYPPFLTDSPQASLDDLLRHAEHFLALGGQDTLALGSDFDGAQMPQSIAGVQSMGQIWEHFVKFGYPHPLLEKIFFKNAWKFFVSL